MLLLRSLRERASSKRCAALPAFQAHALLSRIIALAPVPPSVLRPATLAVPSATATLGQPSTGTPAIPAPCRYGIDCTLCGGGGGGAGDTQRGEPLDWADVLVGDFAAACHVVAHVLRDDAAAAAAAAGPWPRRAPTLGATAAAVRAHVVLATLLVRMAGVAVLVDPQAHAATKRSLPKLERLGHAHIALFEECIARAAAGLPYSDAALLEIVRPGIPGTGPTAAAPGVPGGAVPRMPSRMSSCAGAVVDLLQPRAERHYDADDLRRLEQPTERLHHVLPLATLRRAYSDPQRGAAAAGPGSASARTASTLMRRLGGALLLPLAGTEAWLGGASTPALRTAVGAPHSTMMMAAVDRAALGAFITNHLRGAGSTLRGNGDGDGDGDAASGGAWPDAFWRRFPAAFWLDPRYDTLTAVLARITLAERMHALEPPSEIETRYAWRLWRNSHLDLVGFLCARPYADLDACTSTAQHARDLLPDGVPLTLLAGAGSAQRGAGAAQRGGAGPTFRDLYDPLHGERALHEGAAPRLGHAYEFVDFFSNNGMRLAWNDMRYKLAPRCCVGRKFDEMHEARCAGDGAYLLATLLEIELSLTGGYRHALVLPGAWATLRLQSALRRHHADARTRPALVAFMAAHPQLAAGAGAEAMVVAVATTPAHRAVLRETYPAWADFERATRFNMDVVRHVYGRTGSLAEALASAYGARAALRAPHVYRHQPHNYITFVVRLFAAEDKRRYAAGIFFTPAYALSPELAFFVDRYVATLVPNAVVDLTVLRFFGMRANGMRVHDRLQRLYLQNRPMDELRAELNAFFIDEYMLSAYFFTCLQRHNAVRVTRVLSAELAEAQVRALRVNCGMPLAASAADIETPLPASVGKFVLAPCCATIKTPVATCMDSHAHGTINVAYDPALGTHVCVRKEARGRGRSRAQRDPAAAAALDARRLATELGAARADDDDGAGWDQRGGGAGLDQRGGGGGGAGWDQRGGAGWDQRGGAWQGGVCATDTGPTATDDGAGRLALAQQAERGALRCHETPCAIVPGVGMLIEPVGYRIRRKRKNGKSRHPPTIPLVHVPPFFIAPCCGMWNSYRMQCWTANGYVCGACRAAQRVETRLQLDVCIKCGARPKLKEQLPRRVLWDDVYTHTFASYCVCARCTPPLLEAQPLPLSLLRRDRKYIAAVAALIDAATAPAATNDGDATDVYSDDDDDDDDANDDTDEAYEDDDDDDDAGNDADNADDEDAGGDDDEAEEEEAGDASDDDDDDDDDNDNDDDDDTGCGDEDGAAPARRGGRAQCGGAAGGRVSKRAR